MNERDGAGAERSLRRALALDPAHVDARFNLALTLEGLGRSDEAAAELETLLIARPGHASAHGRLGLLREQQGDPAAGLRQYRRALEADPDQPLALRRAARILATARDPALRSPEEAVQLAERAAGERGRPDAQDLDTLAAAYALAGRSQEAVAVARRAAKQARRSRHYGLAREIEARVAVYEAGEIWLE